ncbi:MAG TPA: glycosyltransferase [Pyrinomonadaceae bacterium]|nr:glycosyltransferase [Pyrinomonadaceae bacterium]
MAIKIGIYNLHMQTRGGGEKSTLALAEHLSRSHRVWYYVNEPPDLTTLERYFDVDLSRVSFVILDKDHQSLPGGRWSALAAQLAHFRQIKAAKLDVFINNSYGSSLPCPTTRGVYMCMFPHELPVPVRANGFPRRIYRPCMDWVEKHLLGCRATDFIDSYSAVTANSNFTARWVRKMWDRHSEVIYSACDNMGPPANKEKIILNVGRFDRGSAGALCKRQDILVDVFNQLTDFQKDGWQLHLAGSVAKGSESLTHVVRLKEAAKGRPVFFHFDADFSKLRDLYRHASIYWHATGYGFEASEHPTLQEHFGITTVEAMSAGAVPVVINSGGQREIVTHAADGFLWNKPSTLAAQTAQLIGDPHLLKRLSRQAILSSAKFSRANFNTSIDLIIDQLMCDDYLSDEILFRHSNHS